MSLRVRYTVRALGDLKRLAHYIEADDLTAARQVARRIRERCDSLADFPDQGRPIPGGQRRVLVITGAPYLAFYRITGETITILHIRHGRQRPQH